jgi:hypothetical protein
MPGRVGIMRWLRLIVSTLLFPISLAWYRRDVGPEGVGAKTYWLVMAGWLALNIVLGVLAYGLIKAQIDELMNTLQ